MRWLREIGRRFRRRQDGSAPGDPTSAHAPGQIPPEAADSPGPREAEAIPDRLIVGLGNPGEDYQATRHNVGFRIVALLAERYGGVWRPDVDLDGLVCSVEIQGRACLLLQPQTFMNRSGESVGAACERWPSLDPASDLIVVYDDLDLPPGRIRLRPTGGGGGHRGIGDILAALETREIPRLRFGVGHPGKAAAVIDWVLAPFPQEIETGLLPAAMDRAADAIEASIREGVPAAMGQFNAAD